MNKLFVILLLVCNLAFAQEVPPAEPEQVEPIIIDIDPRCKNAVVWGISLIVNKENGQTHEQARKKLEFDYLFGALGNARPEVLAYMFDIIDLVHDHNTFTMEEITQTAIDVNALCVNFMDTPQEEVKPQPLKT